MEIHGGFTPRLDKSVALPERVVAIVEKYRKHIAQMVAEIKATETIIQDILAAHSEEFANGEVSYNEGKFHPVMEEPDEMN